MFSSLRVSVPFAKYKCNDFKDLIIIFKWKVILLLAYQQYQYCIQYANPNALLSQCTLLQYDDSWASRLC